MTDYVESTFLNANQTATSASADHLTGVLHWLAVHILPNDATSLWTAVASLAAALATYFAWKTLAGRDDPQVIVYVKHDANRPSLLVLVIENIGRDVARDVKFTTSKPIPVAAWGIEAPAGT